MCDLTIIKKNGGAYIDSREAAKAIGKDHCHLLRDIRGYVKIIENGGLSKVGLSDFFIESCYLNAQNKEMPCYLLSKMGCEIVANKLIGEKGVLFTAAYVRKFNLMEEAERTINSTVQLPRLGEYNATARLVVRIMQKMGAASARILEFLQNFYEPFGIDIDAGDLSDVPEMYTAKQIAAKLGLYSIRGNPHAHAVSCILNDNIFIGEEHKTVTTTEFSYGVGICIHYDSYAVQAVIDWLAAHGFPSEIDGAYFTYHVLYRK